MSEPFIGEIKMMGCNYAPQGYALCNGQLMPIAQNPALFSLLGTSFGGNGINIFALPDFRGRVPMHQGSGPGLAPRTMGEMGGSETISLTTAPLGDAAGTVRVVDGLTPPPSNMMPYLVTNFVIAVQGVYPCRN